MQNGAVTLRFGAYQSIRLPEGPSIAYMNGEAPHLIVRDGSDAHRLTPGQCIPVLGMSVSLVNPFPRPLEVLIARGLPISMGPEPFDLTLPQFAAVTSGFSAIKAPQASGGVKRYGCGLLMKRGRALVTFFDKNNDGQSRIAIFPGVSPAFLSVKPALCMDDPAVFLGVDGRTDDSFYSICGDYDLSTFSAWMAAANAPPRVYQDIYQPGQGLQKFMVKTDQAIFFVRKEDMGSDCYIKVQHIGLETGDFD